MDTKTKEMLEKIADKYMEFTGAYGHKAEPVSVEETENGTHGVVRVVEWGPGGKTAKDTPYNLHIHIGGDGAVKVLNEDGVDCIRDFSDGLGLTLDEEEHMIEGLSAVAREFCEYDDAKEDIEK